MPRYLTSGKVSLLALIDLYISNDFPSSSKFHVLCLLSSELIPSDSIVKSRLAGTSLESSELAKRLSQWESNVPGRSIYDRLLHQLWQLHDLDALFTLFKRLAEFILPAALDSEEDGSPKISRSSPFGQFIRRSCYEFERLQFADVQKLWSAVVSYRARSSPIADEHLEQAPLDYASTQDIENLLDLSIQQLQRLGTRVPQAIKSKLQGWLEAQHDANTQSLQHFMAFFEHWRAGQMSMALESLHQYFDYSVGANRGSENLKLYFQYAQLHQSVLYADFECWEESVNAMNECIATARENQDTACLNFALSWLLHLRQVYPSDKGASTENLVNFFGGSSEQDELAFLKAKARDGKHWSLMSSTLLEEAKLEMYAGGSISRAFENIIQSMFLNMQHDQRTLIPAASLFESASFERLGQSQLASRLCEGTMLLHRSYTPLNDGVRAVCRMAHVLAQMGQYDAVQTKIDKAEQNVIGVVKLQERLAAWKSLLELKQLTHSDRGLDAKDVLRITRSLRSVRETDFEAKVSEITYLIKTEDFDSALALVNKSVETCKESRTADIAQRLQLLVLKCKVFAAAGYPSKGLSIAMRAALTAERHRLLPILTEALSVLSTILISLGEFNAARELIEATLPHALSGFNVQLEAELFSSLADCHVGLSGDTLSEPEQQLSNISLAVTHLERSHAAYSKIGDSAEMSTCLLKKALLERAKGDSISADRTDEMYTRVRNSMKNSIGNGYDESEEHENYELHA